MEISGTESSDSNDPMNEPRITRRSIRVPIANHNDNNNENNNKENRSRSMSLDHKRQNHATMSSSEESLAEKNK